MDVRRTVLSATLVAAAGLTAFAGPALAVCDAYSALCVTPPPTDPPRKRTPPPDLELQRTGTELGLLTAIGGGTLAGGTALVLVARRKRPSTSS